MNGSAVFGGQDGGILANPEGAKKANPITYISKTSAPMLLMHGTKDTVVSRARRTCSSRPSRNITSPRNATW